MTDAARHDVQSLPRDIEALHALVLTTMAERDAAVSARDALAAERDTLQAQNERLSHLLLKLKRMQFGAKSERLPEEQLQLGLEAIEQAIAQKDAETEKRDPELRRDRAAKRRTNRGALPAHLPRIEVTLNPEDTMCPCCRAAMTVIGEDTSERLDVIPAQYRVIVTRRPKFICRACAGTVVQAPAPTRLIESGIPTEALVAHVAVCRYADHQPLYRQAQIMARQGVTLDRSTLAFWLGEADQRFRRRSRWKGRRRVCRGRGRPRGDAAARDDARLHQDIRRRDGRAGSRPGPWAHQAGLLLGDRARRSAMGRQRAAHGGP